MVTCCSYHVKNFVRCSELAFALFMEQPKSLGLLQAFKESPTELCFFLFAMIQTCTCLYWSNRPLQGDKQGINQQIFDWSSNKSVFKLNPPTGMCCQLIARKREKNCPTAIPDTGFATPPFKERFASAERKSSHSVAWFNGQAYHTAPTSLAYLDQAYLRLIAKRPALSLKLTNYPLPRNSTKRIQEQLIG